MSHSRKATAFPTHARYSAGQRDYRAHLHYLPAALVRYARPPAATYSAPAMSFQNQLFNNIAHNVPMTGLRLTAEGLASDAPHIIPQHDQSDATITPNPRTPPRSKRQQS